MRKKLEAFWSEEASQCTQLGHILDKLLERGGLPRIHPPKSARIGPYQWPAPYDKHNPERRVSYARVRPASVFVWSTNDMVDFAPIDSIPISGWTTAQLFAAIHDLRRAKKWMRDRIAGLQRAEQEVLRQKRVEKWVDREVAARDLAR